MGFLRLYLSILSVIAESTDAASFFLERLFFRSFE